jgi:hypothetical protein
LQGKKKLLECIPYGTCDSWGRYESAGTYDRTWNRGGHGQQRLFQTSLVTNVLQEFQEFMKSGPTAQEEEDWYESKRVSTAERMKQVQGVEDWVEKETRTRLTSKAVLKEERKQAIVARCMALDVPIERAVLMEIKSFKRAIDIPKTLTDRSWSVLYPKIIKERAEAQKIVDRNRDTVRKTDTDIAKDNAINRLKAEKRKFGWTEEQVLVEHLCDVAMKEIDEDPVPTIDSEYALTVLRNVHRMYYERCEGQQILKDDSPYRLVLDDARWAYIWKIKPVMEPWSAARKAVAMYFKCPGCIGQHSDQKFPFEILFSHISNSHNRNGNFKSLFEADSPKVDWKNAEWPINLPILASLDESTGTWNPTRVSQRLNKRDLNPLAHTSNVPFGSFFVADSSITIYANRTTSDDGPPGDEVIKNIIYAGTLLKKAGFRSKNKTSLALRYASKKSMKDETPQKEPPSFEVLKELPLHLNGDSLYDILSQTRCGVCSVDEKKKYGNKLYCNAGDLIQHYQSKHDGRDWHERLIEHPADAEIWREMAGLGGEERFKAFDLLFPLQTKRVSIPPPATTASLHVGVSDTPSAVKEIPNITDTMAAEMLSGMGEKANLTYNANKASEEATPYAPRPSVPGVIENAEAEIQIGTIAWVRMELESKMHFGRSTQNRFVVPPVRL